MRSHWDSSQTKLPSAHRLREVCWTFFENLHVEKGYGFCQRDSAMAHIGVSSNSVTDVRNASTC